MEKEHPKEEYITEEMIQEYMKMHTYHNVRGEVCKVDKKYFIKD